MHFLHEGWKQTQQGIRQHPWLLVIIVVVQICLVAATGFTALTYQVKILQNAQNIIEPLQNANYNADNINAGQPFLEDLQKVYANYQDLINNLISLLIWLSVIFLTVNGLLWVLSHRVLGMKGITSILHAWAQYILASVLLLGAVAVLSYYVLRGFLTFESDPAIITSTVKQLVYVLLAVYYLLLVAFAFISRGWKEWIAAAFRTGILRIHKTVVVLLINFIVLGGNLYLIYYAAMNNLHFSLVLLFSLTFLVLLVLTRLFWIACLQQIAHPQLEENK